MKLAAYSHSATDSPKKVRVQKHPQKSPARQPTSQKPVFSTFCTLVIILVPSTFSMIFWTLSLHLCRVHITLKTNNFLKEYKFMHHITPTPVPCVNIKSLYFNFFFQNCLARRRRDKILLDSTSGGVMFSSLIGYCVSSV